MHCNIFTFLYRVLNNHLSFFFVTNLRPTTKKNTKCRLSSHPLTGACRECVTHITIKPVSVFKNHWGALKDAPQGFAPAPKYDSRCAPPNLSICGRVIDCCLALSTVSCAATKAARSKYFRTPRHLSMYALFCGQSLQYLFIRTRPRFIYIFHLLISEVQDNKYNMFKPSENLASLLPERLVINPVDL